VSLKSRVKAGKDGKHVSPGNVKYTKKLFYVRSREKPEVIWCEVLPLSDPAVVAFKARDKTEYPDHMQCYCDPSDTFDAYCGELETTDGRKRLLDDGQIPLRAGEAANLYPKVTELADLIQAIDGMPIHPHTHTLTIVAALTTAATLTTTTM
jgi:hypothetical protein